ncbi:hypothetical protein RG47T_5202 [Mucilaginibacter polytrichastri]|uniref:Uncharacterized protein n=1 Tax=Mucilaginibacter polytrichastri TaxID=1302689 RepID=A0A1Q5ZRW1_9SPHI|nr:hypothetical protein RG47T_5202 [Mucilaginibacter polytrichastri]
MRFTEKPGVIIACLDSITISTIINTFTIIGYFTYLSLMIDSHFYSIFYWLQE